MGQSSAEYKRAWYLKNKSRILDARKRRFETDPEAKAKHDEAVRAWHLANPTRASEIKRRWDALNPEKSRLSKYAYDKSHPEIRRGASARRRARRKNARPSWLTLADRKAIAAFYRNCPAGFEVDHIEPLAGKDVSGLHVPWNLQYLPVNENRKKGNRRP